MTSEQQEAERMAMARLKVLHARRLAIQAELQNGPHPDERWSARQRYSAMRRALRVCGQAIEHQEGVIAIALHAGSADQH